MILLVEIAEICRFSSLIINFTPSFSLLCASFSVLSVCVFCVCYSNFRLAAIRNLVTGKQLMTVLLKLFGYCVKVKANRQELIKLEMNSISIMLGALNLVSTHICALRHLSFSVCKEISHVVAVVITDVYVQSYSGRCIF